MIHHRNCVKLNSKKDDFVKYIKPWEPKDLKLPSINPDIKPRTDEERKRVFETISTSQKGESLLWYNFGDDWTHPYYHKSDGQSALESGLLSLIPTWNKPVERPPTTANLSKPIYRRPRNYDPIGAGYKALWDLDRHQPRYQCGRYTMPDPQTTSLHSLQNPLERHIPIPCIRDQHKLSTDHRNFSCSARTDNQRAYEQQATSHVNRLNKHAMQMPWHPHKTHYDIKDLGENRARQVTNVTGLTTEDHFPTSTSPHNHVNQNTPPRRLEPLMPSTNGSHQNDNNMSDGKKSVSWADNHINIENLSDGNTNNNNNGDGCTDSAELPSYNENKDTTLQYSRGDKLKSMKGGRYYHYMNDNSELCDSDIPIGYHKLEDDISYDIVTEDTTPKSSQDCMQQEYPEARQLPQLSTTTTSTANPPHTITATSTLPEIASNVRPIEQMRPVDAQTSYESYRQQAEYYCTCQPSLYTQKIRSMQYPSLNTKEINERERVDKMKRLLAQGQLHYAHTKRGAAGYTGHKPRRALELPLIKQPPTRPTYETLYRNNFCRKLPEEEYIRAKSKLGHKAPMSQKITASNPSNPFGSKNRYSAYQTRGIRCKTLCCKKE